MTIPSTFFKGIEDLRSVQWSNTYSWDIRFQPGNDSNLNPAPPSPFNTWVPAVDYSETTKTVTTLPLPFYISQYKFPQMSSNIDIQIMFHDDVYGTMYNWLVDWFNLCCDDKDGVAMLEDCWRELNVMKLDPQKNILRYYVYYVIPEGTITESLNSNADTKSYSVQFAVVGRLDPQDFTFSSDDIVGNSANYTSQSSLTGE